MRIGSTWSSGKAWQRALAVALALGLWAGLLSDRLSACPFCTSVQQTFSEEINTQQLAVLAQLIEAPPAADAQNNAPDAPLPKAKFRITEVIKGGQWAAKDQVIELLFFGEPNRERSYLVMGTDAPQVMWATPLPLTDRARDYIRQLPGLPSDATRLEFFQDYLEDPDEMLARDAYDEFAKIPYAGVRALKDKMQHDRLLKWAQDAAIPASRRRLYYTMLGICGTPADLPILQQLVNTKDRKMKAGLDALLACYILLKGEPALDEVDTLFLKDPKAEYADTYAAIMAIRFHGTETKDIPVNRLVQSLRHLLNRPEMADLVIPDLARWQDWDSMPALIHLFKTADEKSSWVRVPVVNYLRSCPLPEAKAAIAELEKIDPEAVKRAQTFFPFDGDSTKGSTDKSLQQPAPKTSAVPAPAQPVAVTPAGSDAAPGVISAELAADTTSVPAVATTAAVVAAAPDPTTAPAPEARGASPTQPAVATLSRMPHREAVRRQAVFVPNRATLFGVPIVMGIGLLYAFRYILGVPLGRFDA